MPLKELWSAKGLNLDKVSNRDGNTLSILNIDLAKVIKGFTVIRLCLKVYSVDPIKEIKIVHIACP
jgi:hypothetical protein